MKPSQGSSSCYSLTNMAAADAAAACPGRAPSRVRTRLVSGWRGVPLHPPREDGGREWSDEGPTFLLFLPLAQAFFGGGANLMISSSEGCRIMSLYFLALGIRVSLVSSSSSSEIFRTRVL